MECPIEEEYSLLNVKASVWTRFIASLEILGDSLILIAALVAIFDPTSIEVVEVILANSYGINVITFSIPENYLDIFAWIIVVLCVVGIGMGVLLWKGSFEMKPTYLNIWMIYVSIYAFLGIVTGYIEMRQQNEGPQALQVLFGVLGGLTFEVFALWVVSRHRKNIIAYLIENV